MSKTYKKQKRNIPCSEQLIKSVTLEYLNYIAERENYPEVIQFVDDVCEAVAFFCPCFEKVDKAFVFNPRINNKELDCLGIEPLDHHSFAFVSSEEGFQKEYTFFLKNKRGRLLGEDLKINVTFFYGLVKISNFSVAKKKVATSLMFPILYPYKYVVNSLESDYRTYYPSKKVEGTLKLSGEAVETIKGIEFDVIVDTPANISCSYKKDVNSTDEAELAFYESHFDSENAILTSHRRRVCYPHKIQTALFYAQNDMGKFGETAIRCSVEKYEIAGGIIANVTKYISPLAKGDKIKFGSFEFQGEDTVSYETSILNELFTLKEESDEIGENSTILAEKILDILNQSLRIEKSYINKQVDLFEYHEVFDERKLANEGMVIQYIKSFKYPTFHIEDDDIKVNGADERRVVESYRVVYDGREFFVFVTKKVRKVCAYLNLLSMETCDLHVGYAETSSALIFEISFKNEERFLRESFVEREFNPWEYLKSEVKTNVIKSPRVADMLKNKNCNVNSFSLYKTDI
ncbi:MAG: hypothetical protein Q4D02_03230 [Clostridia bacterium]|nr:hypothetical protein [Clostridia bacterium]